MPSTGNPFQLPGKWYKANLHTHTTTSDGQATVERRVEQYREAGYGVLAITDHDRTNDLRGMSDGAILVISGMEFHPPCVGRQSSHHLVALNVPHGFALRDPLDAVGSIAQVKAAGGETVLAHPYWSGHGYENFKYLQGVLAVEVFNSTCDRHGRACSENDWASALDRGMPLTAVASDDCHRAEDEDVFEAWTWLRMPAPTVENVLGALRTGACYASCGPVIRDFRVCDGKFRLRCRPAVSVQFVGGPGGQGIRMRAPDRKGLREVEVPAPARPWAYVRAVVTDRTGRKAWTNPIVP